MAQYLWSTGDLITAARLNANSYNLLKGVAGFEDTITLADNVAGTFVMKPTTDPAATTRLFQVQNAAGQNVFYIQANGGFVSSTTRPVVETDEDILLVPAASVTLFVGAGNFQHLRLVGFYRTDAVYGGGPGLPYMLKVQVSGDIGANYTSYIYDQSGLNTATSLAATSLAMGGANIADNTANIFATFDLLIPDYADTTRLKSLQALSSFVNGTSGDGVFTQATGLWNSTAAITSVTLLAGTGNFLADTVFTLFGVP